MKNYVKVSKLFRAYGLYNKEERKQNKIHDKSFKALSSLRVI